MSKALRGAAFYILIMITIAATSKQNEVKPGKKEQPKDDIKGEQILTK